MHGPCRRQPRNPPDDPPQILFPSGRLAGHRYAPLAVIEATQRPIERLGQLVDGAAGRRIEATGTLADRDRLMPGEADLDGAADVGPLLVTVHVLKVDLHAPDAFLELREERALDLGTDAIGQRLRILNVVIGA